MTQATSQASESAQLPTIIIDPSLYVPDIPDPKQTSRAGIGRLARVTLLTGAVGGATVGIAHLLWSHSDSQHLGVAALTKLTSEAHDDAELRAPAPEERSAAVARTVEDVRALAAPTTHETCAVPREPVAADEGAESKELARALPEAPPASPAPAPAVAPAAQATAGERAPAAAPAPLKRAPLGASLAAMRPSAGAPLAAVRPPASAPRIDLEASIRSARRLHALNQLDEAEAAYQTVLAHSAGQSAALIGLARIKLARGQLDAALEFAQRAAREAPDQASVHLILGDVLRARGDKQAAAAEYALAAAR